MSTVKKSIVIVSSALALVALAAGCKKQPEPVGETTTTSGELQQQSVQQETQQDISEGVSAQVEKDQAEATPIAKDIDVRTTPPSPAAAGWSASEHADEPTGTTQTTGADQSPPPVH